MARPTDWSALGMTEDPTPGDPDEIDRIIASQLALIELAKTIEGGLDEVLNTSSNAFKGKTADAIRGKINTRIRGFVTTYKKAHETFRTTMQTYAGVMREQQRKTEEALTAAKALKEDDKDGRETHRKAAQAAQATFEAAAATAATALSEAASSISSPVDDCAEVWKVLTYIAIILIIPAIFTGGTLALVAFALNMSLMIKTAIDFHNGDASVTDLVLSIVGVIAPTTKGLNITAAWGALKGFSTKAFTGFKNLVLGGPNSFGLFIRNGLHIGDVMSGTFTWVRAGVFTGLKFDARGLQAGHFMGGSGRAWGFIPVATDLAVINIAGAGTFFGVRSFIVGLNGIKAGITTVAGGLSGWKGLRLILPVAADEMGQGIGLAIKIGFYERGILGKYIHGAFINGKFIGDLGKISGAAGAGSHFFGEGGAVGGSGLIRTDGFTFSPTGNPFGAGGPGMGDWHGFSPSGLFSGPPPGLSVITPQGLDVQLGAAGGLGSIGRLDLPSIDARLVDLASLGTGGTGGTFQLPTLGPVTPLGVNGGAANLPALGGVTSIGVNGTTVQLPGLGSIPPSMPVHTQIDMPQLGSSVGALPATTVTAPELNSITGALVPVNVSTPSLPSLGHVSVPSLGTVGGGGIGQISTPLPGVDAQLVDLPAVGGLGQVGEVQLGQVNLPSLSVATPQLGVTPGGLGAGEISAPQVGAHLGEVSVPGANAHLGGASVPGAQPGEVSVPGANAHLGGASVPGAQAGQISVPGANTNLGDASVPGAQPGQVSVSGVNANLGDLSLPQGGLGELGAPRTGALGIGQVDLPAAHTGTVNLAALGGAAFAPRAGSHLADVIASVHAAAFSNPRVFVNHTEVLDFQHTFTHLPDLPGVEVRVAPGIQSGNQVDIEVDTPQGPAGTLDTRHVQIGGQDVLRVEHIRPDGSVRRLDYALSSGAGHALIDDQVIDPHITGGGPAGSAVELQPLPQPGTGAGAGAGAGTGGGLPGAAANPSLAHLLGLAGLDHMPPAPGAAGAAGAAGGGGPVPAAAPPVLHVVTLPGLNNTFAHVRTDAAGVITDVRGMPGGHPVDVQHVRGAGPAGADIVRVEHTAVPGVEVLRWDFTADQAGTTLVGSERRFQLHGGALDGTTVSLHLDPDRSVGSIRHLGAGDAVLPTGGRPVLMNGAGLNIPAANGSGFHLYHPATGLPTHTGIALTGADGLPNGLHVLVPAGTPAGAGAAGAGAAGAGAAGAGAAGAGPLPAPRLTGADGMTGLGTVTPHGDVFHVNPTPAPGAVAAPQIGVYGADGTFSHHALPVPAVTLPGGAGAAFVRIPDAPGGAPRLVHADGGAIDGAGVHAQAGGGFRIDHRGRHIAVDAAGVRTHDVTTLHGPHVPADGHFVFTPAGTPNTPAPQLRTADGAVDPAAGQVIRVDGTLHVDLGRHRFSVHTLDGAFSHEGVAIRGLAHVPPGGAFVRDTPASGAAPQLVRGNGTAIDGATVTAQGPDGFRIQHRGQHIAVDPAGVATHNVVTLHGVGVPGTGQYVFTPVGTPDTPAPHPRDMGGGVDNGIAVQRAGDEFLLTDAHGTIQAFDTGGGVLLRTDVPVTGGSALDGHVIRTDADGTISLLRPDLEPLRGGGQVLAQTGLPGGGFRVVHGDGQLVFDARGAHTHNAVELRGITDDGMGQYVFQPVGGAGAAPNPHLKDAAGADLPDTVTVRPDGTLRVTSPGTIRVHGAADGHFRFHAFPLTTMGGAQLPEHIGVYPGGALRSLDQNLDPIDGAAVTPRPGHGFHVTGGNGEFRMFDGGGRLDVHVTAAPGGGNVFTVTSAYGNPFQVVPLGDAKGLANPSMARFVDTTPGGIRLLDGHLGTVHGATVTPQLGGGFRIDGFGGLRQGEFKVYAADGTLEIQRINVVYEGQIKPNQHLELHHVAQLGAPGAPANTWELVRTGDAAPPSGRRIAKWFEGGVINSKGLTQGRVHLTTHSGITVFESRPLPNGNTLGSFQSSASASISGFSLTNQRGVWNEMDAAGTLVRHGTRHWGESFRSWFDSTGTSGVARVTHFQQLPDGGHVIGSTDRGAVTQSLGKGTWFRYDADFKLIAQGDRQWGQVRGFTDTMKHPLTGETVVMHEKFGRFQPNTHDVRRLFQQEIGADGIPKTTSVSLSAPGKEIDSIKVLENGDVLAVKRMAEQRPPIWYRYFLSGEMWKTDFNNVPWFKNDSLTQFSEWSITSGAGADLGNLSHGIRLLTQNGALTDIASNGHIVRETRKLINGNDLTVGNVKVPDGPDGNPVHIPPGYLPFSEGVGKLQGHRSFNRADFDAPTGIDVGRITWQDRYTTDLGDGDWFTPNAGKHWEVARTGLNDGSVVEWRPQPALRPDGGAGNGDLAFRRQFHMYNGDWTRYDHHGYVVARSDTWPAVGGAEGNVIIEGRGPSTGRMSWSDAADPAGTIGGPRLTAHGRDINPYGWDRESYQDFTPDLRLIRDHQLLADGTTVDAWRVSRADDGTEVWNWRKVDVHGNIKEFGNGPGDQVRRWIDANGNVLSGWRKDARWSDHVVSLGNIKIQEIPAKPDAGVIQNLLGDKPFRIREFVAEPGGTFNQHVWKEFDTGAVVREKKMLPNGTYLESETWQQHWRQYGPSGLDVTAERAPSGFVYETDAFGKLTLVGRETDYVDWANQYRGYYRMLTDPNRWEFGSAVGGESTYRPFLIKAGQQLGVEMSHEFAVDFFVNLLLLLVGAATGGAKITAAEFGKIFYGSVLSAAMKGAVTAAHQAYGRGTPWKNGLSHIDYGFPYQRHPTDDNWRGEWAGHEKVARWRGTTYTIVVGTLAGTVGGLVSGASTAAVFGVKNAAGELIKLRASDAVISGLMGSLGGFIGAGTLGAARSVVHLNIAGRWYHRAGVIDIFLVPTLGKIMDKYVAASVTGPLVRDLIKPSWYLLPSSAGGSGSPVLLIDPDFLPQGAVTP
ncbi:hypothetical protein [Streptomyces sp. NPDC090022]|uniref:hypothetical protein n=1 Tax=Streptomyces sp. NPDC090022 TaxID=3365920 RepID=UPI0037FC01FD